MTPVFITGTGTGVGKTIVSIIICNALRADYWKPVQSGNSEGTDTDVVRLLSPGKNCHPELYNFSMPVSPHLAARNEHVEIDLGKICAYYDFIQKNQTAANYLVIEGAGGLLVPLNEQDLVADLILQMKAKVIIVSRNYLGSINHSLLTAEACRSRGIDVIGWVFNDEYLSYQDEIATRSGYPVIGSIPKLEAINREILSHQSDLLRDNLLRMLEKRAHD